MLYGHQDWPYWLMGLIRFRVVRLKGSIGDDRTYKVRKKDRWHCLTENIVRVLISSYLLWLLCHGPQFDRTKEIRQEKIELGSRS